MLGISIAVAAFLIVGSLLVGSMLGWVLREYMMYHHDREPTVQPTMHPEMFDENGNYNLSDLISFRYDPTITEEDDAEGLGED